MLLAEDETAIEVKPLYIQERDEITGFCGPVEYDTHHCQLKNKIVIGADPGVYNRIKEAYDTQQIGSYLQLIMVNPLQDDNILYQLKLCITINHVASYSRARNME